MSCSWVNSIVMPRDLLSRVEHNLAFSSQSSETEWFIKEQEVIVFREDTGKVETFELAPAQGKRGCFLPPGQPGDRKNIISTSPPGYTLLCEGHDR